MPAVSYRPILDVPVKGSVSKTAIRKAVEKLAALRKTEPKKYRAKLRAASGKHVTIVMKETPARLYKSRAKAARAGSVIATRH